MNLKRGFFRLWLLLAVLWVGATVWSFYDDLLERPWTLNWASCSAPVESGPFTGFVDCGPNSDGVQVRALSNRWFAIKMIGVPPIATFLLGCALLWVGRGFRTRA